MGWDGDEDDGDRDGDDEEDEGGDDGERTREEEDGDRGGDRGGDAMRCFASFTTVSGYSESTLNDLRLCPPGQSV